MQPTERLFGIYNKRYNDLQPTERLFGILYNKRYNDLQPTERLFGILYNKRYNDLQPTERLCPQDDTGSFQIAPPYSVIGGDAVVYSEAGQKIGRQYPWGFAEVNNEEHCDYITLHDILLK